LSEYDKAIFYLPRFEEELTLGGYVKVVCIIVKVLIECIVRSLVDLYVRLTSVAIVKKG